MHNEYNFSIIFNRSPAFVWKEIWFVYIFVCFHVCYCKMLILYYIYIFGIVLIKQQLIWERKNCHSLCVHVPAFFPCSISSLSRFFSKSFNKNHTLTCVFPFEIQSLTSDSVGSNSKWSFWNGNWNFKWKNNEEATLWQ